jgi:hypothetical protein
MTSKNGSGLALTSLAGLVSTRSGLAGSPQTNMSRGFDTNSPPNLKHKKGHDCCKSCPSCLALLLRWSMLATALALASSSDC